MKRWLYFLVNKQGKSYFMNNGVVELSATLKQLSQTPDGWQDLSIGYERDMNKLGVTRSFTVPLGFVGDGAAILTYLFNKSIEEEVFLFITRLELEKTGTDYRYIYKPFYKGEIDLTTYKKEDFKVTVNIMESGLHKLLKAHENTTYEFNLDTDSEAIVVKMDGVLLTEKHNWINTPDSNIGIPGNFIVPASFINKEGNAAGFASLSTFGAGSAGTPDFANSEDYIFVTAQAITGLKIKGSIVIKDPDEFTLYLASNTGQNINLVPMTTDIGVTRTFEYEATFNGAAEERFFLAGTTDVLSQTDLIDGSFSVEFQSRYKETYIKAFKPLTLFNRLGTKIAGNTSSVASTLLETYKDYAVTCGDAIRSLANSRIKTSLNQFFETWKAVLGAGIGIENNKIIIEKYAHFLNPTDPIHLGKVKDLKVTFGSDLCGNKLKIGYNKQDTDDVNGKYAFNNTHNYTLPVTKLNKEISLISPYFSDPYAIELLRINLEGKTTTDNSADNDVFLLNVKPTLLTFTANIYADTFSGTPIIFVTGADAYQGAFLSGVQFTLSGSTNIGTFTVDKSVVVTGGFNIYTKEPLITEITNGVTFSLTTYELNRPTMTITGVPSPTTIFNVLLSPKRMLQTQGEYIASILHQFAGQKATFQTTEKNADLVADGVTEKADYTIGDTRLFLNVYVEFETEVPIGLPKIKEDTPNKAFSFEWNDTVFTGFDLKAGIAPNDRKPQAYKLLLAPDSDLSKL